MGMSLVRDAMVRDRLADAIAGFAPQGAPTASLHFVALCRGLIAAAALMAPIGFTLLAQTASPPLGDDAAPHVSTRSLASFDSYR